MLRVEFFDDKTQGMIGFDEVRLRDIPESFKDDTWVEIDGDRWKVVSVEPTKMRTARKDGVLKVHVNLVEKRTPIVVEEFEQAPVEEVKEAPVYRNPSRADQMPRMSGKREDLALLEIATYEWRDIEFTVASNRSTVRDVFGKIEELISLNSTERDGRTFYTRQYDRYDMFAPMRGIRLPLETVIMGYFQDARSVDGLTFMGADQVADSTFVFRLPSGIGFYGQEFDDIIRYFAVVRPSALHPELLQADIANIASLMKRKELIMVDWQARKVIDADESALYDYFLQGFANHAVARAKGHEEEVGLPPIKLEKEAAQQPPVEEIAATQVAAVIEGPKEPVVAHVEAPSIPVVETAAIPLVETAAIPAVETVAIPVVETPSIPVVETAAIPVVETKIVMEKTPEPVAELPVVTPVSSPEVSTIEADIASPTIEFQLEPKAEVVAPEEKTIEAPSAQTPPPVVTPTDDAEAAARRATYLANLAISQQFMNATKNQEPDSQKNVEEPDEPIIPSPDQPDEPLIPSPDEPEEPIVPSPDEPEEPSEPNPEEFPITPEEPSFPNTPSPEEFPMTPEEPSFPDTPQPEEFPFERKFPKAPEFGAPSIPPRNPTDPTGGLS